MGTGPAPFYMRSGPVPGRCIICLYAPRQPDAPTRWPAAGGHGPHHGRERVFPDTPPNPEFGNAEKTDLTERELEVLRELTRNLTMRRSRIS